jgi:hypothetical protein
LALIVPLAGGATGGVADGDRFSLTINGVTTTFEFDRNGNFLAGNRPIQFNLGASQAEIRNLIFQALNNSGLLITPRLLDEDKVFIGAQRGVELNTNFANLQQPTTTLGLRMPALGPRPGGVTEGQRFQISDGRRTVTFEYDTDGSVATGNFAIDFASAATVGDLTRATLTALKASPLNMNPVQIAEGLIHLGLSAGGDVAILNSAVSVVGIARTLSDGERFTITTAQGTATFEMTQDANVQPGNVPIGFSVRDTQSEIGDRIVQAIRNAALGLNPSHRADGNVAIGGSEADTIDVSAAPSLDLFGRPGVQSNIRLQVFGSLVIRVPSRGASGVVEDSTFVLTSAAGRSVIFEMDGNRSGRTVPGSVVVAFNAQSTAVDIATAIAFAINAQGLGIQAVATAAGEVRLGQIQASQLNLGNTQFESFRGVVNDGETFVVNNGTQSVTFEFDNADLGNGFNVNNTPILFGATSTPESVVQTMKAVIEGSPLGLTTTVLPGGILELNASPRYKVNTALAPTLLQTGVAGGAKPVQFLQDSNYSGADMVDAISRSINLARQAGQTSLIAIPRGGDTLFVENANFISTNMDSFFLRGVSDQAGNLLQPNRINNDTAFTILMPGIVTDFGDTPDPFENSPARYPTLRSSNGARHVLATDPGSSVPRAILGTSATSERDGQSSPDAGADQGDDGVVFGTNFLIPRLFNRHIQTPITVTISSPGFVDGWIDWNADGDWDDPSEQILSSIEMTASQLTRTFMVTVPATAPIPSSVITTYARFRSSTVGGLTPRGLATDGEVEDYDVRIAPGTPPVSNDDIYSVNEDGRLVTSDPTGQSSPNFPIDDGVAANDGNPGNLPLSVVLLQGPANAVNFRLESNGTFEYVPVADFHGVDTFVYRVNDGTLNSNTIATVTINVQEVNDPPMAVNNSFLADEDTTLVLNSSDLLDNDSPGVNEAGQTITITRVDAVSPRGGRITLVNGVISYTAAPDFWGTDTFTYTITDNGTTAGVAAPLSSTAVVTVTVRELNDAPILGSLTQSTNEDTSLAVSSTVLLGLALPGPVDEQAWQGVQFVSVLPASSQGGSVSWNSTNNTITYVPRLNFAGTDTFFYEVIDRSTDPDRPLSDPKTSVGTVTVTVTNTNDSPTVQTGLGGLTMNEDDPAAVIDLSTIFTDPDIATAGDVLTYRILSNSNTAVALPSITDNRLTVQLRADANGQSFIVVEATDRDGLKAIDTLTLTVNPVNDAPRVATPLPDISANKNSVIASQSLLGNFFDPDILSNGDVLTYRIVSNSNPLVVTPTINGSSLDLTLVPNQFGLAVISVSATDSAGLTVADEFTLTVNNVNEPPTGRDDNYSVPQGTLLTVPVDRGVLSNDGDPEGSILQAVVVRPPLFATEFTLNPNGSFTYRHNGSTRTTDTFTYRATDGQLSSGEITVTITINPPPPPSHQNPINNLDVNADGRVTPIDALLVINLLNERTSTGSILVSSLPSPPNYYDVSGDNRVTGLDVLLVINELNRRSSGGGVQGGEGEGSANLALLAASMVVDVCRSEDNRPVAMKPVPVEEIIFGPLADTLEAPKMQDHYWTDLTWIDHAAQDEDEKHSSDQALAEMMESLSSNA